VSAESEHSTAWLQAELRSLGESLTVAPPTVSYEAAVLHRLAAEPVPSRQLLPRVLAGGWRHWRRFLAGVIGLLLAIGLVPPVRATVADWFNFGGVVVRQQPGSPPTSSVQPPAVTGDLTLARAAELVGFPPIVPRVLGTPTGVSVSSDRRVLSMTWSNTAVGTVRLDEFNGGLSPLFVKLAYQKAEITNVHGELALWFGSPHELIYVDARGAEHTESARLAGRTLIWQRGSISLRLEGNLSRNRAIAVAESAG
jgi:hypothetical protein